MRRTVSLFISTAAMLALAAGCYHDDHGPYQEPTRCDPVSGCLVCDGNTCYPFTCDARHPCLDGYTCTASGRCASVAADDLPASDVVCDNAGCQVCRDTEMGRDCTAFVCDAGHECPDGYLCEVGSCRVDAGGGDDCATECCANADCEDGFICSRDGACVERPAPPTPECDAETPCPTGEVCEAGACVTPPPECEADGDCGAGEACVDGKCETKDFPVRPADRCVIPGDCGPDGTCLDGACHFPCDAETVCPVTQACVDGLCRALADSPGECVLGADCPTEGARCIDGTCRPTCAAADECQRHERCDAERGICEPDPRPIFECLRNADCAEGRDCVDGRCLLPCADDTTCAANEACEQGWCLGQVSCFDSAGCGDGEVCVDGSCETL